MKKFLSLVLALIMTMSLVTVSAGATDFKDDGKVTYQEAVTVMSAIGVIDGYTDGTFNPQGGLTRGAAAKIICNMILGPTTAAALHADTAPFKDVPVDHTYAGYIAYCAQQGIISGYTDGAFRPAAPLTSFAFMKMLLGALGYDAEIEGYVGGNSFINVAKQAIGIGLNKGLKEAFEGGKLITREEACLFALNTLKATMVEYDQKIIANVNGAQITVGTSLANEVKWNIAANTDGNIKDDGYVQFAEKYFTKLELQVGNGIYGRPANTWKLKKAEVGTFTSIEPTKVYTEGTDGDDIYKDLGKVVCSNEYDWTAFINGEEVPAKEVKVPAKGAKEYAYTGEGTVTEIYVNDDDETVTVVEINYYLGEVTKVKTDDDGEYITVKALSKGAKLDDKTFYVEGYEEDDYVVFTIDTNDDGDKVIGEVCEPEVVTAEVTRVENDKDNEVVDGVYGNTYLRTSEGKYTYTDGADSAKTTEQDHMTYNLDAVKAHPELNVEYDLYLDPNGFVLGFKKTEKDSSKYLWVKDSDEELKDWVAKVVLDDATAPKVDLKSKYTDGKNDVSIAWTTNKDNVNGTADKTNIDQLIWKYTVSDKGVYTLKKVTTYFEPAKEVVTENNPHDAELYDDDGFLKAPTAKINNGRAYINLTGSNVVIVDNETLFVDVENEKVYTGYKEVPNVDNAQLAYVKDSKNIAEVVFILDGDIYDKDSTYFVLSKTTRESLKYDGDYYWEYSNAYVNGEKTKVYVSYDAANDTVLVPGVLYKATKTVDEQYIVEFDVVEPAKYTGKVDVVTVGVDAFWIDKDQAGAANYKNVQFDTNDETVYVVVEYTVDGKWKIYSGDINDMKADSDYEAPIKVQVVERDEETAELVYIYKIEKGAEDVKPTKGNGTIDVEVQKGDRDGDKVAVTLKNPLVGTDNASDWKGSNAVVTITMTVDGETYTKETEYGKEVITVAAMLAGADTPNVGVAPTGTHKLVVSATVKFDGEHNDSYTLVGESNVLYW